MRSRLDWGKQWQILAIANAGRWPTERWRGYRVCELMMTSAQKKEPQRRISLPAAPVTESAAAPGDEARQRVQNYLIGKVLLGWACRYEGHKRIAAAADDCNDDRTVTMLNDGEGSAMRRLARDSPTNRHKTTVSFGWFKLSSCPANLLWLSDMQRLAYPNPGDGGNS